jgi:predicted metal-dependent enzyme (double-stranded beta helix superfamily)
MIPLRKLIRHIDDLLRSPPARVEEAAALAMRELVSTDDWLPDAMAQSHPSFYQQHLLYADPLDRYSVVSFVWGPGQKTPIHNHTVWGVIGVLRGAEYGQRFDLGSGGAPVAVGEEELLKAGSVDIVSATHGDVHLVRNAFDDRVSISIHLYGANIGKVQRSVFDEKTGKPKVFVSGYTSVLDPALLFPENG